jgi:hypothetical protein
MWPGELGGAVAKRKTPPKRGLKWRRSKRKTTKEVDYTEPSCLEVGMEGAAALFGCQCAAFAQLRTRNRKNNQIRYPPALGRSTHKSKRLDLARVMNRRAD